MSRTAIILLVVPSVIRLLIVFSVSGASTLIRVQIQRNALSNVSGVPGIELLGVLLVMQISSKQVYLFVHRAFYERGETCSRMIKQAKGLFRDGFTPELLTYAVQLYSKFERSAAENSLYHFAKGHFCNRDESEGGEDVEE